MIRAYDATSQQDALIWVRYANYPWTPLATPTSCDPTDHSLGRNCFDLEEVVSYWKVVYIVHSLQLSHLLNEELQSLL